MDPDGPNALPVATLPAGGAAVCEAAEAVTAPEVITVRGLTIGDLVADTAALWGAAAAGVVGVLLTWVGTKGGRMRRLSRDV